MEPTSVSPPQPSARRRRISLRVKIVALAVSVAVLVAAFLVGAVSLQLREVFASQLRLRGEVVAQGLGTRLVAAMGALDAVGVQAEVERARRDHPDLVYLVLRGGSGELLAHSVEGALGRVEVDGLPRERGEGVVAGEVARVGSTAVLPFTVALRRDPRAGAAPVAQLQLGFDMAPAQRAASAALGRALAWSLVVLLVCVGATLLLARMLTNPVERLSRVAAGMAQGDLQQPIEVRGDDEIAELASSFESMSGGLRSMIGQLRQASAAVEAEASSILATSTQQSSMSNEQASAINETSTTVSEIAQTSKQATDHADTVIRLAQRSEEHSRDGQRVVAEVMEGLDKLNDQVRAIAASITDLSERTLQIGDIIATVKELAEQSNLLALNASIEASKAGEHGRGFAVVAAEMRNLAEQSKVAAGEVRAILSEVQRGTRAAVAATEEGSKRAQAAVELARSAGGAISGLAEVIRDSSLAARQIANNTRQQTIGVEQIVAAIGELSGAMNDALEGTRRIESVAANLSTLSRSMSSLVNRYRV